MNAINRANLGWAVLATVFHTIALFTTVFRLVHRFRTSRMWWDDYIVTLPLAPDTVFFASLWTLFKYQLDDGGQNGQPLTGINSFWAADFIVISVLWFCRISIALTFARLFPALHQARRYAFFLVAMYFLAYLCCISIITFKCPAPPAKSIDPHCQKGGSALEKGFAAASLHIFGDIALVSFPIITLWKLKLPQNLRSITIWAFSGSSLTLITVVIFIIVRYDNHLDLDPNSDSIRNLVGHLEAAVSLMVCNLLVIVSFFYRIFRQVHDIERTEPPTATQVTEDQGVGRETSIGRVSVIDTENRPLSFTLTRLSEISCSSIPVSEPILTQNMSSK